MTRPDAEGPVNRRREARFQCRLSADLKVSGRSTEPMRVTICDLSESGFNMRATILIERNSSVRLRLPGLVVFGTVSYSDRIPEASTTGYGLPISSLAPGHPNGLHLSK